MIRNAASSYVTEEKITRAVADRNVREPSMLGH
jgi:hypothetical protein